MSEIKTKRPYKGCLSSESTSKRPAIASNPALSHEARSRSSLPRRHNRAMPELEDHRWLASPEAARLLDDLAGTTATPAVVQQLRKATTAARAGLLIELAELRRRGAAKFSHAGQMHFTRRGLEQATDEWIARYKAQRFQDIESAVDICSGVGGDLIGLAGVCGVTGIDRDPVMAGFAELNASVYGNECKTLAVDADEQTVGGFGAWHADPDRRPADRRTSQPESHEPPLSLLEHWRESQPNCAVKLAPAAQLPDHWQKDCELEWVSRAGECRQQVAWSGALAQAHGKRRATRLAPTGEVSGSFVGTPHIGIEPAPRLGRFVYDLDPSVLAASLDGALATAHGLASVSSRAAYLTGDIHTEEPLLSCFEVIETLALDRRRLASWLKQRNIGKLEIKCRGVDITPEKLRKELKPQGDGRMTLLICPAPGERRGKTMVIAARRTKPTA